MNARKLQRRLDLLDSLLDFALRSECRFSMCDGPTAPIRHMRTCTRCACIHRAVQMGMVKVGPHKGPNDCVVLTQVREVP